MTIELTAVLKHLELNDKEISPYYRLATILIVISLLSHLGFATYFILSSSVIDTGNVNLFIVFNVSALIVELYLIRIAFMLGSRAGQLRDLQYALRIAGTDLDPLRFEIACRAIMATRRDSAALKVFDIEGLAKEIRSKKTEKIAA